MSTVPRRSALIVGSSSSAAFAIKRASRLDYEVHTASNALQALALVARRHVELVLYEHDLPGRPGAWLARQLERSQRSLSVVALPDASHADPARALASVLPEPHVPDGGGGDPCSDAFLAAFGPERRAVPRSAPGASDDLSVRIGPGRAAVILDLSSTGVRLGASHRVLPGATIVLRGIGGCDRCRGLVVWSRVASVDADHVSYEAGVRLADSAREADDAAA